MKIAKFFKSLAVLCVATLTVGATARADTIEMRIAMMPPPNHVWTKTAYHFAEELKAASNGEMVLSVFPAGQLGNENDMFQQFQIGALDLGIFTTATLSTRAPGFTAWSDPFLFADLQQAVDASAGNTAQAILDELEPQGLYGGGYVFAGMRHILTAGTKVTSLADLKNQKIRIHPFPAGQTWWRAAGAVPTPVNLGDVYQSLNSGLLDGVDIDLDALIGFSMQQVAKHLAITNHMAFPGVIVMSDSSRSKLSSEQKEIFDTTLAASLAWGNALQVAAEKENLTLLQGELEVNIMANAKEVFADANAAFDKEYGDLPAVKSLRTEVGK